MSDPVALYIRYLGGNDLIREAIESEKKLCPSKKSRDIVEGWIKKNTELNQKIIHQKEIIERLDLLIDIHNSYIINENLFAVYPTSMKTSDMIRALEDERKRVSKRSSEQENEP